MYLITRCFKLLTLNVVNATYYRDTILPTFTLNYITELVTLFKMFIF